MRAYQDGVSSIKPENEVEMDLRGTHERKEQGQEKARARSNMGLVMFDPCIRGCT